MSEIEIPPFSKYEERNIEYDAFSMRKLTRVADTSEYFKSLPEEVPAVVSELNFMYNSPPSSDNINRIKKQNSNDKLLMRYSYNP